MESLKNIGKNCAKVRRSKGYTQLQVSFELGYSPENISAFECGRNDNTRIFLWYLDKCVTSTTFSDFMKGVIKNEH